jgi:hypothetical protein
VLGICAAIIKHVSWPAVKPETLERSFDNMDFDIMQAGVESPTGRTEFCILPEHHHEGYYIKGLL